MIRVSELTKDYASRRAIDELTFDARQGEILGFLGPNGAGKTTTMRILAGYMPPTSGTATVAGFDVVEESLDVRRRVGYMPETVPLYTEMTVFDYLKYMADLRHLPKAADAVDETLETVGLLDRSGGYISNLSKGMRQRVGLAQALLHKPEVLILDEPTIGLDPAQIIEVRNIIREAGKERTVLLSTHILSEAQQICDRVLIISEGHIVAEDTPGNLQTRLMGGESGFLRVRGDASGLVKKIAALPDVTGVRAAPDGGIEFQSKPGQDVRADAARLAVDAGLDLLELRTANLSLEEIFLQLTAETPGQPPEAG
jgi:ABC-2 type transport system ATP-binding protein